MNSKTTLLLASILLLLQLTAGHSMSFPLNLWKNYDLNSPILTFSHSQYSTTITLPQRQTDLYSSHYLYDEESLLMEFKTEQDTLTVLSVDHALIVSGLKNQEKVLVKAEIGENLEVSAYRNFSLVACKVEAEGSKGTVYTGEFDMLIVGAVTNLTQSWWQSTLDTTRSQSQAKLSLWMKTLSVPEQHLPFATEMLSQTLSMLCKEDSYIGLCDFAHIGTKHQAYQIDIRYSFLVLDLLHAGYAKTSMFVFENMIGLFEDRLFYEGGKLPFVPVPEHLGIFASYYKVARKEGSRVSGFSMRVKAVLNGFINRLLLSEVNNLEEEKNYRETESLHPTLAKMVRMKWKSTSAKRAVSSIYQESFTPDYLYNYPHEIIDTCISKWAWVTYATFEYIRLVNEIGDSLDKSAAGQPLSLLKILRNYGNYDNEAAKGNYYSTNVLLEGAKLYIKQGGYESILPFIYGLTDIFPETMLNNITTKHGLASLNIDHPKIHKKYEYRGNIHSYFNYKLLFEAKHRLKKQGKKNSNMMRLITGITGTVKEWILKEWSQGRSFTMWSPEGEGLRNKKQLSVINVGLLRQQ